MAWDSLTASQKAMYEDQPGGWKCLHHQAQSYSKVTSIAVLIPAGCTPSQDPSIHTRGELLWTSRLGQIHFSATLSQRQLTVRGGMHPHRRLAASVGDRSDRLRDHSMRLQLQESSMILIVVLRGVTNKIFSQRTKWLTRDKGVWGLDQPSLMGVYPGWVTSGRADRNPWGANYTQLLLIPRRWTWRTSWKQKSPFSRCIVIMSHHCKICLL